MIGLVILVINLITEVAVKIGSTFIKSPRTRCLAIKDNIRGISWQEYINLAVILPFIYMN